MKKTDWTGRGYIALLRQSNDAEGAASTGAQLDYIIKEATNEGMHFVDKIPLEGVTGMLPGRREDLKDLLKRKLEKNDFDVLAVQVQDRLTRGGGEHGLWIEHECKRHGIRVFFAGDDTPKGPYSAVVRVSKYEAAFELSSTTGKRTAQGASWAKKAGFFRTAGQTPMGCHRIYYGQNDTPRYILRNLADGRQEQIDAVTKELIGTFGTVGKKSRNRFVKQRNEYSLLISGDPEQKKTVNLIFELRYKKGWRGNRIAKHLNGLAIPAPKGRGWSQRQVESIYENEAYTGFTYNNQTYSGRIARQDEERGYVELDRDECDMAVAKYFLPVYNPMATWKKIDQPHMHDFLPADVRQLAATAQLEMWLHRLDPERPKKPVNASPASPYLLTNKLTAMQDQEPLSGTRTGPRGKKVSYYRHKKSKRGIMKESIFNNLIPAQPLHAELLKMLGEIMLDAPNLRPMLREILAEQRQRRSQEDTSNSDLEMERSQLDDRMRIITSSVNGAALQAVAPELTRISNRRNEIEIILKGRSAQQNKTAKNPDDVVEEAINRLGDLAANLYALPEDPIRRLIDLLVKSATVDMATKAVRFEIAVPVWSLKKPLDDDNGLCPATSQRSQDGDWTQRVFAVVECDYNHRRGSCKPVCYRCRRMAA